MCQCMELPFLSPAGCETVLSVSKLAIQIGFNTRDDWGAPAMMLLTFIQHRLPFIIALLDRVRHISGGTRGAEE